MKLKWFLTVAGLLLVALSVIVAVADDAAQRAARAAAGTRLETVRTGASAEIVRIVRESREALAAWTPGTPAAAPLRNAWTSWGEEDLEDRIDGTYVTFTRTGAMDVFVEVPGAPDTPPLRRKGRIAADVLRDRIEHASGVGGLDTGWTRIALVDQRGAPTFVVPGPERDEAAEHPEPKPPEKRDRLPEWERLKDDSALGRIKKGLPGALEEPGGMPLAFRGMQNAQMLGVWAPVATGSHLHLLVEVDEAAALGDVLGFRVRWAGKNLFTVKLWYAVLSVGLLTLFVAFFFFVAGRYTEVGPLIRVYSFARPYVFGIAAAVFSGAVFSLSKTGQTFLLKRLADEVFVGQGPGARAALGEIVVLTVALGLAMAVSTFFKDYLENYYSQLMVNDVKLAIGRRLVKLPLGFFHRMRTGDLNARIERDVAGLRGLLNEVFDQGFVQPFTLVGALVAAFVMNAHLAVVLLGMPIIVVPLFRIARKIKKRAERRQVLIADISHVIFQILSGIKIVKAFGGEDREVVRLAEANRRFIREARKIQRLSALSKGLMDLLQMAGGAALIYWGGIGVLDGGVSLGDLMAFMLVSQLIYNAAKELTGTFNKVIEGTPAVLRVFEVLDAPDTLTEGERILAKAPLRTGVELRGVRFRYLETDVLRGVDLAVPAGQVVALVGPTGAGKTTICDLVVRYYDPTAGAILYDGVDVREFTKRSLMESVAIVTQDAFLFNTTIEENIRYGKPDATHEEIEAAARDAFVHEEIVAMDGGYRKSCGERGQSLSGGQRQRVTIARALLKDAPLLILDEATSNLDSKSEAMVQAALAKLMAGRTVIVVAHRLSTIRNADRVVVLEKGVVVEEGAPSDLLAKPGGRFRAMYEMQMGERGDDDAEGGAPQDPSGDDGAGTS